VVLREVNRHALDKTTLTADIVAAKIRSSYLGGVTRCYRARLAKTPAAKATLTMAFRVDDTGAATAISAVAFDREHDNCVVEHAKSWRFPIPRTKSGAPEVSDFSLVIDLAPASKPAKPTARVTLDEKEKEVAARIAKMLASDRPTGGGDGLQRKPGADLSASLDAARGSRTSVAIGGAERRGSGVVVGTGRGPSIAGPADKIEKPVEQGPAPRITLDTIRAFDTTTLSSDTVRAKTMSAYTPGLKRCYRNRLRVDPGLRGKVTLAFTVSEAGRAVVTRVKGFDPEIDGCMTALMAGWRFPIPKDADGEPIDGSFEMTLALHTDEPQPPTPSHAAPTPPKPD
jgi:hypothetical protein